MGYVRSRPLVLAPVLGVVVSCLLVIGVQRAEAHDTCTTHPEGSVVCLKGGHTRLDVCDRDPDGHRVYVRRVNFFGTVLPPFYDDDGAGGQCGHYTGLWSTELRSYNVCVEAEGCGRPVYYYEF